MAIEVGRLVCSYSLVNNEPASGKVWVQPVNFADDGEMVIVPVSLPFEIVEGVLDATVVIDNADIDPDLYLQITEKIVGAENREPYVIRPEGAVTDLSDAPRYVVGPISPGPGEASTITVGTTTTGAAGTDASVANVGTATAAVLDFTIPRGETGLQGPQGNPGSQGIQGEPGVAGQDTNFVWQDVLTGSEPRPAAEHVLWVGGTTQPINMAVGDIWMQETV